MMTNNDFPRILTLLRKERGFSQKKAAADLGISQALLSHYEKGIRECGLDFLVRAANYYGVSCDYLLGRTPHRSGAAAPSGSASGDGSATGRGSSVAGGNQRKMLINSLNIVFGILKKINSEELTRHVCAYFSAAVYKMFRALYSAREKNPQETFSLDRNLYASQTEAHMTLSEGKACYLLSGGELEETPGLPQEALPVLNPEKLLREYPLFAPSLFEMIQNTEQTIAERQGDPPC